MYILEGLTKRRWHLLIQILMMPLVLAHSILYKLICASLLDIIVEPRQVELVHAEADKVEKWLDDKFPRGM